jgi:hypothetical protein
MLKKMNSNLTEEITRKHQDNKALHFSSSDMLSFINDNGAGCWMWSYLMTSKAL